jgi:hypothetical protein
MAPSSRPGSSSTNPLEQVTTWFNNKRKRYQRAAPPPNSRKRLGNPVSFKVCRIDRAARALTPSPVHLAGMPANSTGRPGGETPVPPAPPPPNLPPLAPFASSSFSAVLAQCSKGKADGGRAEQGWWGLPGGAPPADSERSVAAGEVGVVVREV